MIILSIETSADETAVSLVETTGDFPDASYTLLGNALRSQVENHRQYGGIFPSVAKREHAAALVPLLTIALSDAALTSDAPEVPTPETTATLEDILNREPTLAEQLLVFVKTHGRPPIDLIAVTSGPGLEPALWVGINFARALSHLWNVPVVPVNHMEGHVLASVFDGEVDNALTPISFPAIALLISGGHTELLLMHDWKQYEKIGHTRDDAVGEAYDKVARLLDLPYPGGPEIEKRAREARRQKLPAFAELPTPMLHSGDLDMSFSGLKTAVRYAVAEQTLSDEDVLAVCRDFEDAVTTVLLQKAGAAMEAHGAGTLVVGGGVSASGHLRATFMKHFLRNFPDVTVYFPATGMSTDNSVMIALAGHARADSALSPQAANLIRADGNRSLAAN